MSHLSWAPCVDEIEVLVSTHAINPDCSSIPVTYLWRCLRNSWRGFPHEDRNEWMASGQMAIAAYVIRFLFHFYVSENSKPFGLTITLVFFLNFYDVLSTFTCKCCLDIDLT